MSTEDGERLGVCMEWDGEHAGAVAKGMQHLWQHNHSHAAASISTVAAMESAVQGLLAEMGECP